MNKALWNLFKETGKIEYYIKYKMLEGKSDTLGDKVTLTASPFVGYKFDGWYEGETIVLF